MDMASTRRMGPKGSEVWHAMLDAAEVILAEEGAAALTSRRVAEVCGVKQRLVYYYFATMEELIVETLRRLRPREMARLDAALASPRPLHAVWEVYLETEDTRLVSEFMALANRIEAVRIELAEHIEESRRRHVAAIEQAFGKSRPPGALSPAVLSILATNAAMAIHREARLGIAMGHAEAMSEIARMIDAVED